MLWRYLEFMTVLWHCTYFRGARRILSAEKCSTRLCTLKQILSKANTQWNFKYFVPVDLKTKGDLLLFYLNAYLESSSPLSWLGDLFSPEHNAAQSLCVQLCQDWTGSGWKLMQNLPLLVLHWPSADHHSPNLSSKEKSCLWTIFRQLIKSYNIVRNEVTQVFTPVISLIFIGSIILIFWGTEETFGTQLNINSYI